MAPRKALSRDDVDSFDWEISEVELEVGDELLGVVRAAAVAFRVEDDGYVVAFTFATTSIGEFELVGFTYEWVGSVRENLDDRMREIARRAAQLRERAPEGLTVRRLRITTAHAGLLAQARREFETLLRTPQAGFVWYDADDDDGRDLALLVVEYGALINEHGRGARSELARRRHLSENSVRNMLSEAKRQGLWATAGRGRTGQPTAKAHAIVRDMQNGGN